MAKPKKVAIGGGHAVEKDQSEVRWLISYSDFMMQLVCLFILLYSVSSLDKGKMALVAAYYRASIGLGEPPVKEPATQGKNLAVGDRPLVGAPDGRAEVPRDVRYKVEQVTGGWMVRFNKDVFDPRSSALPAAAQSDLDAIAARFRAYAGTVFVTGFAAHGPPDGEKDGAMKLAQARAEAIASHLTRDGIAGGFDARFLQAAGRVVEGPEALKPEILVRVK